MDITDDNTKGTYHLSLNKPIGGINESRCTSVRVST